MNQQKKILFLGAAPTQIPPLKYAREQGHHSTDVRRTQKIAAPLCGLYRVVVTRTISPETSIWTSGITRPWPTRTAAPTCSLNWGIDRASRFEVPPSELHWLECRRQEGIMRDETPVKRWTAKRKSAVVTDIFKGKTTPVEVARQHDLTVAEVKRWVDETQRSMENGSRTRPRDGNPPEK